MQAAGVATDRFLIVWESVQPSPGSFSWATTDALVGGLASHGIRPVASPYGNPDWIPGSPARAPLDTSRSRKEWRIFVRALVHRYGPGGSYWSHGYRSRYGPGAVPRPIRSWEVWNEPNLSKYFSPRPSAREYARLLRISGRAIKSEDPGARIVLAGTPRGDVTPRRFLKHLYRQRGFKGSFDVAGLHPYGTNISDVARSIERIREVLNRHGGRRTPLWLTELGWGSGGPDRFGLNKGAVGQARLLERSFGMILRRRHSWRVRRLLWFDWRDPRDPSVGRCSICATAGLLNYDRSRKPAYFTFSRFAHEQ
jgi:polysaccharide biosynthesis protein PslG